MGKRSLAQLQLALPKPSRHPSSIMALDLHGFLNPNYTVAISFWIISISMVAATVFFLMESTAVSGHWKTSMNVGALVTLVAAVHYFYMREFWVLIHTSPILYRYIDWTITVPLQMIELPHPVRSQQQDHPGLILEALDLDCGHACVRLHWRGSLVPWRCLGGLRWWHVRLVLHPLRDLRWRGRIRCWRAWISQQVHPGLVRHHASHCHCRLVYLPSWLLLWLPHGWCQ